MMRSKWFPGVLAGLLLMACGSEEAERPAVQPDRPEAVLKQVEPGLFARIDATTPFLYANLERLPEALADRFWRLNDALYADQPDPLAEIDAIEDVPPLARALVERLGALSTQRGWTEAGLHPNPRVAIHGVSVFPVIHLELADPDAFAALLEGIAEDAGTELPLRRVGQEDLVFIELGEDLGAAIHYDRAYASFALVPDREAFLGRVSGGKLPDRPFDPASLADFNRQFGFTPHGSGYIDWSDLVRRLLSGGEDELANLARRPGLRRIADNPACVAEYTAVVRALPRMVWGATRVDAGAVDFLARQETGAELGQGLAPIAETPVRIDRELEGVANFGFSMNLLAARDFARGLVGGWVDSPPECPTLARIAEAAPEWQLALNRPIPPVVTNLQGLFVEMQALKLSPEGIPTGGGALAVYMRNPQLLVGMAQMFSPAMAALDLRPGGQAQPVPAELIPQLDQLELEAFMAMGENAVGLAVGEASIPRMEALLAPAESAGAILAGRIDFARLARLLAEHLEQAERARGNAAGQEALEGFAALFEQVESGLEEVARTYRIMAEHYDQGAMATSLGPEGIEFSGSIRFRTD